MLKPEDFINVDQSYIESLIENKIEENIHLDYKEELGSNAEIAKDLSSFANTDGGNIIYGVREENNKPKKINLIKGKGIREKLDQIARFGIDPPLNVRILPIDIQLQKDSGQIFLIFISKKYPYLHQAISKGKYYKRTEYTSTPMMNNEIRLAFELSYKSQKQIKKFIEKRILTIKQNKSFITLYIKGAILIMHLIPEFSIYSSIKFNLDKIKNESNLRLSPINCRESSRKWKKEGLLSYCGFDKNKTNSYTFFYDNGIIESVGSVGLGENVINTKKIEKIIIRSIEGFLGVLNELNISLTSNLYLSFIKIQGYCIPLASLYGFLEEKSEKIKESTLYLPRVKINTYDMDIEKALKPSFDYLWRACGEQKCLDYDENSKFLW